MCSIGWKRLDNGYLVFKSRDRYPDEKIRNRLMEDNEAVGFGDDVFPGMWFGINKKYGFAVLTAWGPRDQPKSGSPEENFSLVEDALRFGISPESALERFDSNAREKGLMQAYNLIFADSEKAAALEWAPHARRVQFFDGMVVRTNDFVIMDSLNLPDMHSSTSSARRRNLDYIFPTHESPEEMKSLLSFHSDSNPHENVCRHDYAKTIASAFAYVGRRQIRLFYSLDRSPEERNYLEKNISTDYPE